MQSRKLFQSTPPMQGETITYLDKRFMICYFNPLPLCRGRLKLLNISIAMIRFQSTPPMQGETKIVEYFNSNDKISIHSPYAGGDLYDLTDKTVLNNFNPLPLCRGRHG